MEAEAPQTSEQKKSPKKKLLAMVSGAMILEAVVIVALVMMFSGGPGATQAKGLDGHDQAADLEDVELLLVDDIFQNMQTGKVWVWKTEIHMKVRPRNVSAVEQELSRRSAEIKERVGQVIRRANHAHLREPDLRTLNRQFSALANELFGKDESGQYRVERVIISRCEGFSTD